MRQAQVCVCVRKAGSHHAKRNYYYYLCQNIFIQSHHKWLARRNETTTTTEEKYKPIRVWINISSGVYLWMKQLQPISTGIIVIEYVRLAVFQCSFQCSFSFAFIYSGCRSVFGDCCCCCCRFYNHVNLLSAVKQTHAVRNVNKIHKTHVLNVQLSLI